MNEDVNTQMACHVAQTPFDAAGTCYDAGLLVGLWVSAYEILVHDGKRAHENAVKVLRTKTNARSSDTRMELCRALYGARHDYLHGNPIKQRFKSIDPLIIAVNALGIAQITAWGTSFYCLGVLAKPIVAETG